MRNTGGGKTTEFRPYGPRWNERTCPVGREVVMSHGYGTKRRLRGVVAGFERSAEPTMTDAWRKCYGDRAGEAACIRVELTHNAQVQPTDCRRQAGRLEPVVGRQRTDG